MKFFEKISRYETWDSGVSLKENLIGGASIGVMASLMGAKIQTELIKEKLKTIKGIKNFRPSLSRVVLPAAMFGGVLGLGKHFYEQDYYTK
jgi:hypothetical protein